jgi:hypothetical protein
LATNIDVYFCEPQSPWQRGSNEKTNGLLRQYFPKGADLSVHSQAYLNKVARQLNERPRETLQFETPAARMGGTTCPPWLASEGGSDTHLFWTTVMGFANGSTHPICCLTGCLSCPTGKSDQSVASPCPAHLQKYSRSRLTQIKSISTAVPSPRGATRDRHGRGAGCGGR